jgi:glycosyltransferase involved in cell wall biosynthesis
VLIDAVKQLKNFDFVLFIAGKGNQWYENQLKEQVKAYCLEDKICFLGFIENVSAFIHQIDIGIAPSVWREPFGLSVIEFMQAGKPVITTNNGAQSEYITNREDGILIPPSDEYALSEAIRYLLENSEECSTIGKNAQTSFQSKLSFQVFYNKIISVYYETNSHE